MSTFTPKQSPTSSSKVRLTSLLAQLTHFSIGNIIKALKSVILLNEKHAGHPKTIPSTARFLKAWFEMDAEARTTACGGKIFIDVIEKEVAQLGGPKTAKDLPKWVAGKQKEAEDPKNRTLEAYHEGIKLSLNTLNIVDKNAEKLATKAL